MGERAEPARADGEPVADHGPLLLSVDDVGRFLVMPSARVLVGHRSGPADLGLLADLQDRHARFELRESFHRGSVWWLVALPGARAERNGEPVESACALADGDELLLGNLRLSFRLPDASSQTARLELRDGFECRGAPTVLLLPVGTAGRIRIGPARHAHVRLPRLGAELELWIEAGEVRVLRDARLSRAALPLRGWTYVELEPPLAKRPPASLGLGPVISREPGVGESRGLEEGGGERAPGGLEG